MVRAWGVNYLYGSFSRSAGCALARSRRRARHLEGGAGSRRCRTPTRLGRELRELREALRGRAEHAVPTAWAAGRSRGAGESENLIRGARYLLDTRARRDLGRDARYRHGFPGVFYLRTPLPDLLPAVALARCGALSTAPPGRCASSRGRRRPGGLSAASRPAVTSARSHPRGRRPPPARAAYTVPPAGRSGSRAPMRSTVSPGPRFRRHPAHDIRVVSA